MISFSVFGHLGHQRRAAHQHDGVELVGLDLGLVEHQVGRVDGALQQIGRHVLELFARDLQVERLALVAAGDRSDVAVGEVDLGLIGVVPQHLQRGRRLARIEAVFLFELLGHVVDDAIVPVDAAQVDVAIGGQHLEVGGRVAHDGDVERAAAQVVDQRHMRFDRRPLWRPVLRDARHR